MSVSLTYLLLLALFSGAFLNAQTWGDIRARKLGDWLLDGVSLLTFFAVLPVLEMALVYKLCDWSIPHLKNSADIGWLAALVIYAGVDYAWYWNHRLLHARTPLWNLHSVHHEARHLDLLASQRNTIWSFLAEIYFWVSPVILYLAKDPAPFLTFSAIGMLIAFWGHTRLDFPKGSKLDKALALVFIQPQDHFWHHSEDNPHCNFATVFNFWDKIHGTWHRPGHAPEKLGFDSDMPLWRKIIFPI